MGRRQFGSLRRLPSGRWQARYLAPDGVDRSVGTYDTKAAGHKALVQLETEIQRGNWLSPAIRDQSLREYAQAWLANREVRPRTRESYEDQLRLRILPGLGDLPLSKITPRHVREWHSALVQQADEAGRGHKVVSSSYRVLRAIFNTAIEDELVLRNPCMIRGASTDSPSRRPTVSEKDVWALADAVPDLYKALVWLAAAIALRSAELGGLRRCDVDLDGRRLYVRRAYIEPSRSKPYFGPTKSEAGERTLVLPAVIVPILAEHLARFSQPGEQGLVFVSEKGHPFSRHNRKWWRAACKATGLDVTTRLHDLRHGGLTLAAQSGATLKELMAQAGHSSPRAALIYQHAASERATVVADAVSERLSRPTQGPDPVG